MNKPEWEKELNEQKTQLEGALNTHKNQSNIHRTIYVSTATPSASDGANGDIWLTIEA